jgi:hypothetical protein
MKIAAANSVVARFIVLMDALLTTGWEIIRVHELTATTVEDIKDTEPRL